MSLPNFYTDGDAPRRDATRLIVLNKILGAILAGGGGGGGGANNDAQGAADPSSPPNNPAQPAYYTNLTTGTIFTWNVSTQGWI